MTVTLGVRNESLVKGCFRSDVLRRLAGRVLAGEEVDTDVEISLLFVDDHQMRDLNRRFRKIKRPTDVLAFAQDANKLRLDRNSGPVILGDIVISLETVANRCRDDKSAMRQEVRLLFCHGLLHLLGYDHGSDTARTRMVEKQAAYLHVPLDQA